MRYLSTFSFSLLLLFLGRFFVACKLFIQGIVGMMRQIHFISIDIMQHISKHSFLLSLSFYTAKLIVTVKYNVPFLMPCSERFLFFVSPVALCISIDRWDKLARFALSSFVCLSSCPIVKLFLWQPKQLSTFISYFFLHSFHAKHFRVSFSPRIVHFYRVSIEIVVSYSFIFDSPNFSNFAVSFEVANSH